MSASNFCLLFSILALGSLASCNAPVSPDTSQSSPADQTDSESKHRQAEFLNRIRDADPEHRTIDRALLNDRNELGLVLDRTVEMEKIPQLMRTMVTQMAREFPGQDLTVIAYAPSDPPRKIGAAHLEKQSGAITYTPAQ